VRGTLRLALHVLCCVPLGGRRPKLPRSVLLALGVYRIVTAYHTHRLDELFDEPTAKAACDAVAAPQPAGLLSKVRRPTGVPHAVELRHAGGFNSCSSAGSQSRPRRCDGGCTRWGGVERAQLSPATTTAAGRELARIRHTLETLGNGRWCCLPTNSTFTCCPRSAISGCQSATVQLVTPGQIRTLLAGPGAATGRLIIARACARPTPVPGVAGPPGWAVPKAQFTKVWVVVDNYGIHKAKAVGSGWRRIPARVLFLRLLPKPIH